MIERSDGTITAPDSVMELPGLGMPWWTPSDADGADDAEAMKRNQDRPWWSSVVG